MLGRLRRRDPERRSPWYFLRDYRRALPYLKPYRRLAGVSFSLIGVGALVGIISPWPFAILVDTVLGDQPLPSVLGEVLGGFGAYELLAVVVGAGLAITALENGLGVVDNYVNTKLDQRMVLDLRSDLFRNATRLSLTFHDKSKTGQLMYQINNQASAMGAITVAIPPLLQSLVMLVGMLFVTWRIDWRLAALSLAVVPFIYWSSGYYARRIEPRIEEVSSMEGQSLSIVHEAMAMLRVIVAFGREGHEYRRFRRQSEEAVDARVRLTVRQTMFSLAVNTITAAGNALVLGLGAYFVLKGQMTVGELLVVMGYVAAIYQPLEQISLTLSALQLNFVRLRSALRLLDTEPEIKEAPDAIVIGRASGEIAFEGVNFAYRSRKETLKDISFVAPAGKRVAIVGQTGAGKSTLVSLIPRFYDPEAGRVLLDGTDLRLLSLDSLREQVSIVLQEPLLFSDTIVENIRYGKLDATDEEVVAGAPAAPPPEFVWQRAQGSEAANAHEFVSKLPKGYETELGERGAQLSGGERQRIAVARAFLKDAPVLILDEPTSSIDSKTEAVILDALDDLMVGRTSFMIAHRLSTVRHADLILVMSHGEIVEQGSHDELLEAGGAYSQLYAAQVGRKRRRAVTPGREALREQLLAGMARNLRQPDRARRMALDALDGGGNGGVVAREASHPDEVPE